MVDKLTDGCLPWTQMLKHLTVEFRVTSFAHQIMTPYGAELYTVVPFLNMQACE